MRRALVPIALLLAAVALAACGKDSETADGGAAATTTTATSGSTSTTTSTETRTATTPPTRTTELGASGCEKVAPPEPKGEGTRSGRFRRLDRDKTYTARLQTNCGTVSIRLDVRRSPRTSASFASLARAGFYDGLTFHRIARPGGSDFVVQGGDPTGTGNGGPGYSVREAPPDGARYTRGVVAMAKTEIEDAGTSGSQFFIVTARDAKLPADYAILGRVVRGMRAVSRISRVPADPTTDMPAEPVVIEKLTITER